MKKLRISRLFHWLYATLMLAPIFAIGISCLTHVFNKEVEMPTQSVEINYKYETNEVNTIDDLILGNYYMFKIKGDLRLISYQLVRDGVFILEDYYVPIDYGEEGNFIAINPDNYVITLVDDFTNNFVNINNFSRFEFYSDSDNFSDSGVFFYGGNDESVLLWYKVNSLYVGTFLNDFVIFGAYYGTLNKFGSYISAYECPIEYLPIDSVVVTENELPNTNIFYYSVDKAMNSPYFSWASDSFLVEPFKYLGNLFNVPSDNPIYLLLSYWLDISVIWLVFDLVMYVPMLVHSWIDKSAIGG